MNAFFSGTDDRNEVDRQSYGVYGKLNRDIPEFVFRFVSNGQQIEYDPSHIFTKPVASNQDMVELNIDGEIYEVEKQEDRSAFNGPWPRVEYPDEWMEQHHVSRYQYNKGEFSTSGSNTGSKTGTGKQQGNFPSNAPQGGNIQNQLPFDDFDDDEYYGYYGQHAYDPYAIETGEPQGYTEGWGGSQYYGTAFSQQSIEEAIPTFTKDPAERPYVSVLNPYTYSLGNQEAIREYKAVLDMLEMSGELENLAYYMVPMSLFDDEV